MNGKEYREGGNHNRTIQWNWHHRANNTRKNTTHYVLDIIIRKQTQTT